MPSITSRGVPYPLQTDSRGAYPTEVGKPLAVWINDNLPRIQKGVVTGASTLAADGTETISVTFPTAFPSAPMVITGTDNARRLTEATSITATGFTLGARNVSSANSGGGAVYRWIAVL